jgi:hypothetical protein
MTPALMAARASRSTCCRRALPTIGRARRARRRRHFRGRTGSSSPTAPATRRPPTSPCCCAGPRRRIPFFGICFGNQLLGRALGFGTYKLKYGHRGINQPVHGPHHRQGRGHRAQPRVRRRRPHRHGATRRRPYGRVRVSHVCLNDDVVEGLECLDIPPSRCSTTPRRRPGRTTRHTCSTGSSTLMALHPWKEGGGPDAQARGHHSVLVIGSGPIVIGQACEFDYSGTQACRVLREEGIRVILVNSNPATIMTDPEFADATYVEPITPEVVERSSPRSAPTRCWRPSAARPRSTARWRCTSAASWSATAARAHRRQRRGDPARRGPRAVQGRRARCGAESARSIICHTMDEVPRRRGRSWLSRGRAALVHHGRARLRLRLRRDRPAPDRRRRAAVLPGHRGAPRGVDPRLEGVRARGDARPQADNVVSSARSRTSTRWACTPATRSPWRRR